MILDSAWRKATGSVEGNCVEVRKVDGVILDEEWRKSTRSNNNGACAEVRLSGSNIQVRDSKDPDGSFLTFTPNEWLAFIDGVNKGEFNLS